MSHLALQTRHCFKSQPLMGKRKFLSTSAVSQQGGPGAWIADGAYSRDRRVAGVGLVLKFGDRVVERYAEAYCVPREFEKYVEHLAVLRAMHHAEKLGLAHSITNDHQPLQQQLSQRVKPQQGDPISGLILGLADQIGTTFLWLPRGQIKPAHTLARAALHCVPEPCPDFFALNEDREPGGPVKMTKKKNRRRKARRRKANLKRRITLLEAQLAGTPASCDVRLRLANALFKSGRRDLARRQYLVLALAGEGAGLSEAANPDIRRLPRVTEGSFGYPGSGPWLLATGVAVGVFELDSTCVREALRVAAAMEGPIGPEVCRLFLCEGRFDLCHEDRLETHRRMMKLAPGLFTVYLDQSRHRTR